METYGYKQMHDSEESKTPQADNHKRPARKSTSKTMSAKSDRAEAYSRGSFQNFGCPPSLSQKMRPGSTLRSARNTPSSNENAANNKCIHNNFDAGTLASATSLVYNLANPCGITMSDACPQEPEYDNHGQQLLPTTPSTVGSSFSDDSTTSPTRGESYENPLAYSPPVIRGSSSKSKSDNSNILYPTRPRRPNGLLPGMSIDEDDGMRPVPPARTKNHHHRSGFRDEEPEVVLVGTKEYPFPPKTMGFASKYFWSQRRKRGEGYSYVDLSMHSSEDFDVVMKFFENNRSTDAWDRINWKNLPVILPWFVEFQALPMMSAVDTFLLQNGLGAGRGFTDHKSVSLSNLLALTRIVFQCELESTKMHARRLLRKSLLEPRKQNPGSEVDGERQPVEVAEDIELEWTLDDLRALAELMESYDELRDYLWEYAVIGFLPHDLDISDSVGLVSNKLFPYLLREGMMQMMIVQGIESSFTTNDNSFHTEGSGARKACLSPADSFISEHTSCSDTTIPTTPSNRNKLTEEEMQHYLKMIKDHLEKFRNEKESKAAMYEEQHENSLVVNESTLSESVGGLELADSGGKSSNRPRREHGSNESGNNRGPRTPSTASRGRGMATFAC